MDKATLSITTAVFPPEEITDCLEFCAKLGLAGVELVTRAELRESPERLRELRAACDRLGGASGDITLIYATHC